MLSLFVALFGGVVLALVWLAFWLLEDRCSPEPKKYIVLCFIAGMAAVWPTLFIEQLISNYSDGNLMLLGWAATEELFKFAAAYFVALRFAVFDEPLDAIVYLVTAALGFAAMENALFLLTPIAQGELLRTIVTGDLRFVGATLLHTLASATVGLSLALSYYRPAMMRRVAAFAGVVLAVTLHTLFNFFILNAGSAAMFGIFLILWCGIIALLFMIERIKVPQRDYC